MDLLIERVFTRSWFWCVFIPLIIATCASAAGKNDLMEGMFLVGGVFGVGHGLFYGQQNGFFKNWGN